jgi:DNA-binding response OmpR family regulator
VHRLRKSLQDLGATAAIHTIRGVGYLITAA